MDNPSPTRNGLRKWLFAGGAIVFVLLAVIWYLTGGRIVSTDDAYVKAARVDISANISGRVTRVFVKENQAVHEGDPLFELDGRNAQIAVEDAQARLVNAGLQITALKATYVQHQADVQASEATRNYAARELFRQEILAGKGISSQAQLDTAQHAVVEATRKLQAARQGQNNLRALLGNRADMTTSDHPSVQQAQAALSSARLAQSYTLVRAPMDGVVAKVDQLQVGNYINAATPVFALMSDKNVWVVANYKETQLAYMRIGQKATISIDAYPDRTFHGHVESFSAGTGSSFALLPPENASGNWVKVVQRLPVRIHIDDMDARMPLASGLSVVVDVDTHHSRLKGWG